MAVTNKLEAFGGDIHLDAGGVGVVVGALTTERFPEVAAVADGVAITTIQATLYGPPRPFRVRGAVASIDTITGAATFDVYNSAGTPATILAAPKAFGSAKAQVVGVLAAPSTVYAAGSYFTIRVTTAASTGALTNVRGLLEIETLPS